ncbi:DNA repair protein complementing XP-A cells [Dermacentor albipictus]|uniref:DNA repair protein complementing XP-A cells n=1 Tax=Dermacentor albipictus TaxID=60249 RepID=UPI0031FDA729
MATASGDTTVPELTEEQRKAIAEKRERAIQIRKAKLALRSITESAGGSPTKQQRVVDTGGGFLLDNGTPTSQLVPTPPTTVEMPSEHSTCGDCGKQFLMSFLLEKFALEICDNCRDKEDKHKLVTRTDCKNEYLLKDCDLDLREPPLKYILKPNPHHAHGNMKLYLKCQVEERAIVVWGSLEALDEQLEKKDEERSKRKRKAFNKRVKELRMTVRSSLYRPLGQNHEHTYGPESHDSDIDEYFKICTSCGHRMNYEKM